MRPAALSCVSVPAGFHAPDGTAIVQVSGTFDEAAWTNDFAIKGTAPSGLGIPAVASLASAFLNAYASTFPGQVSSDWAATECRIIWSLLGVPIEGAGSGSHPGGHAATSTNASQCMVISWHDGTYYRGGKPRTYMTGISDSVALGSTEWTSAATSAMAAAANTFHADVNALTAGGFSEISLGVFHRVTHGSSLVPWEFQPFIAGSATVRQKQGSQRRRLRG